VVLKGSKWRARYRTPDDQTRSRTFDRKIDAERFLTNIEHNELTGAYVDPSAGRMTLQTYAERWRASQVHRPTTAAQVETNLRRHVSPTLGTRPLGAIRPSEVQAWVSGRAQALSPGTVRLVFRYLSAVFRAAVADRLIAVSPCAGVKLPKVEHDQVEPLTVEEVEALIAAVPSRYRALVVLLGRHRLRQGECFGLTVDRLDFLRRTVRVYRQLVLLPGAGPQLAPPKTHASRRTVPLPAVVVEELAAHLAAFRRGSPGWCSPMTTATASDGPGSRRCGVPRWSAPGLPAGTGFHAPRHFYASLLIRHGESVKTVQMRLGHASAVETLNTYSPQVHPTTATRAIRPSPTHDLK
jgi:integrase